MSGKEMPPSYIIHFKISKLPAVRDSGFLFLGTPHSSPLPVIPPGGSGFGWRLKCFIYLYITIIIVAKLQYHSALHCHPNLLLLYNTP